MRATPKSQQQLLALLAEITEGVESGLIRNASIEFLTPRSDDFPDPASRPYAMVLASWMPEGNPFPRMVGDDLSTLIYPSELHDATGLTL